MKSPSKQQHKKTIARPAKSTAAWFERVRPWLLAVFVGLCVARPLVPSEGVSWLGDGHPFTMLLLLVAAGYLVLAIARRGFTRPFHVVDAAVAALVLLYVTSATLGVVATLLRTGSNVEFDTRVTSLRPAINMLWEWVGLGLVYFLARQLIVTRLESRALVAAMIALAVVLSSFGLFQVFVSLPAERAAYAADPDAVLEGLGQWYPPNSPERGRFEDRLGSSEPTATFALANSLAGYLAPWLIVALGATLNMAQSPPGAETATVRWARLAGLAVCLAAILACLVLTKSRSAYLAVAVGLVLLPLSHAAFRRMLHWRWIVAVLACLALVIGAAVAVGGLDAEVLSEASKSLGYRLQYWQSTLDMIADYPFLGVAPGDYQSYYTQYKLPEASEEIRDPHNFVLEVWATGGTFAFLALMVVLAGFAWHTWAASAGAAPDPETTPSEVGAPRTTMRFVAAGAAGGVLFAYVVGLPFEFALPVGQLAAGLVIGGAVMAIVWPWIAAGALPQRLPALGVLVLSIHLLAAGGFMFPGVAGTFWILLAVGLNGQDCLAEAVVRAEPKAGWRSRLAPAAALAVMIAAAVACYFTALLPVLQCRAALALGVDGTRSDAQRVAALVEAGRADPLSAEPAVAMAQLCLTHLRSDPQSEAWGRRFLTATQVIVARRGHSAAAWNVVADWYREIYALDPEPEMADRVVQLTRVAAYLYPNSATIQGEYALALAEVNKTPAARRAATQALELDAVTPHADKKLSPQLKQQLEKLLSDAKQPGPTPAVPGVVK